MEEKNRDMIKIITAISIFLLFLLLFLFLIQKNTGFSKHETGYRYLLGMSLSNSTAPRNAYLINTSIGQRDETPDINMIVREARDSSKQQIEDINELLGYGIDLLIISPVNDEELHDRVKSLEIPVIIIDEKRWAESADAYIEYDNLGAGKLLAEHVNLNPLSKQGIVLLTGGEHDYVSGERLKGFFDGLYPELSKKITTLNANWNRNEAENRMKYFLVSGQQAGVVVGLNDQMAYGSYLSSKKLRKSQMSFYGINGFQGANAGLDLVQRNILMGTVAFEDMYQAVVNTSVSILNKEPYENPLILKASYIN